MSPIIIFFIILSAGIVCYFWICIQEQQAYLERICYGLTGRFRQRKNFGEQIFHYRGSYEFEGQYSQRALTVRYFYKWRKTWQMQTEAPDERLDIQFPLIQKFWLRMILQPDHANQSEEVILGNPALDSLYVIHSNQPEVAREFLTSQAALQDLQRLPYAFDRLEIHKGWGRVEFLLPARRNFDRMHLEIAVEALARLFSDYETRSKLVIVVSISPDTRCPYCREVLSEKTGDVIRCIRCNARIHQTCWNENKQCTTWGCSGGIESHSNVQS